MTVKYTTVTMPMIADVKDTQKDTQSDTMNLKVNASRGDFDNSDIKA